jgi:acyl transferase domain-containing protein
MQDFPMRRDAGGQNMRTPQQDLARAELLQRSFPNGRTELAALAAAQALAAHERRAGLIAQLHKQAIAAADDMSAWQRTLKARIDKDARRRKVTTWLFAGTVSIVALACVVALLWF